MGSHVYFDEFREGRFCIIVDEGVGNDTSARDFVRRMNYSQCVAKILKNIARHTSDHHLGIVFLSYTTSRCNK